MTTNEFRRGNIVIDTLSGKIGVVGEIHEKSVHISGVHVNINHVKPVELTGVWLTMLKCEKDGDDFIKDFGRKKIMVSLDDQQNWFVFFQSDIGLEWCEVAFNPAIHELQNIVFALTGEELTIK